MVNFEKYSRIAYNNMKYFYISLFSFLLFIPIGVLSKAVSSEWLKQLDNSLANRWSDW